ASPANLGQVINDRLHGLSLPGLPAAGTRDDDWFKFVTPATDGRLDVTATPSAITGGNVTLRIWNDANGNGIPDAGEMLAESTSSGGAPVTVQAPASAGQTLFVQVFDPAAAPFSGLAYDLGLKNVDRFDKASPTGAANNTSATATDLGAVVDHPEAG